MKKLIQKVFQTWQNQFTVSFIYLYQLLNYYDWSSFIRVQVQENDSGKEEDILFDIAHKLKKILESRTQVIEMCNQKYRFRMKYLSQLDFKTSDIDQDIMIDVILILWHKLKSTFQRIQTGAEDNFQYVSKLEDFSKVILIYLLNFIQQLNL